MKAKRPAVETVADRIERMLPIYERLNAEADRLIDQYIADVIAPGCPGVPRAVLRGLQIDNRFSHALNYPEVLRYLRQARA